MSERTMVLMQVVGMELNLTVRRDILSLDTVRTQNPVCYPITRIFNQGALINMFTSKKWRSRR
jgi:hypothetical protein